MEHYTALVHGQGLVDWSPERVDAHAATVLATHQPFRRWVPHRPTSCRCCGEVWPCGHAVWAEGWGRQASRALNPPPR